MRCQMNYRENEEGSSPASEVNYCMKKMAISLDFYSHNKLTKRSDTANTCNLFTEDNYSKLNTNGFDDI